MTQAYDPADSTARSGTALVGDDAERELERMGLTADLLVDACLEGHRVAFDQHAPFEPVISLGFQRWSKTVGALRGALDEQGWGEHDRSNAPRSVSPDGMIVIAAIGGTSETGLFDQVPENARAHGRVFKDEVAANAVGSQAMVQAVLDLPGMNEHDGADGADGASATRTWFLLYFWDDGEQVLRCELSLPVECRGGVVIRWERRILLPEISLVDIAAVPSGPKPSEDVNFEITSVGR